MKIISEKNIFILPPSPRRYNGGFLLTIYQNGSCVLQDKGMEVQRTKDKTLKFDKSELNQKLLQEQIEVHKTQYSVQFQENAKTDKQRLDYMNKAMQFQNGYLKFLEQDKVILDVIV